MCWAGATWQWIICSPNGFPSCTYHLLLCAVHGTPVCISVCTLRCIPAARKRCACCCFSQAVPSLTAHLCPLPRLPARLPPCLLACLPTTRPALLPWHQLYPAAASWTCRLLFRGAQVRRQCPGHHEQEVGVTLALPNLARLCRPPLVVSLAGGLT